MNFKNGTAKTLLDKVVDYKIREKAGIQLRNQGVKSISRSDKRSSRIA
jgi:hypothetical protein